MPVDTPEPLTDVTGRDRHIIDQALAIAYAALGLMPILYRPESNRQDMRTLLHARLTQAGFSQDRINGRLADALIEIRRITMDVPHFALKTTPEENAADDYDRASAIFERQVSAFREEIANEPPGQDQRLMLAGLDLMLS